MSDPRYFIGLLTPALIVMMVVAEMIGAGEGHHGGLIVPAATCDEMAAGLSAGHEAERWPGCL